MVNSIIKCNEIIETLSLCYIINVWFAPKRKITQLKYILFNRILFYLLHLRMIEHFSISKDNMSIPFFYGSLMTRQPKSMKWLYYFFMNAYVMLYKKQGKICLFSERYFECDQKLVLKLQLFIGDLSPQRIIGSAFSYSEIMFYGLFFSMN